MAGPPKARRVTHGFGGHKMKSSSSSSDLLHKDPNSTTPAAVLQASPTSKTALYRLTYHLKDLSQLVVLEIETLSEISKAPFQSKVERIDVEAGPGGKWELTESRKLRHKALSELLDDPSFRSIRCLITVNVGATRSTDHIILPASVKNNPEMRKALLPREIKLKTTKDVRVTDTNGIQVYKQATKCVIVDARTCGEDRLPDVYWPSLNLVIRKRATQGDPNSKFRIDSEFLQTLPESMESWKNTRVDVVNPRIEPNEDYQTVIRKKMSLDRNNKTLHINFDVVVQFPKKNVEACLGDLFGGTKVKTNIRDCFPVVERFLKGLRVRCRYIAPTEKEIKAGGKGTLLDHENDPEKILGRVFQIKGVKFSDDKEIENFIPAGASTSMTVLEYFRKFINPKLDASSENFPLVCDDKKHWIPLSMLIVDDPHAYAKCPRLIPILKEKGMRLLSCQERLLRKLGDDFFDEFATPRNNSTGSKVESLLKAKTTTNEQDEEVYDTDYLFINEVSHAVL